MDNKQSPSLIYDKGNYIILGGFWNGDIIINKLEDNRKNKNQKIFNIISTKIMSPITIMKLDSSETFLFCVNKLGIIFIYSINKEDKIEFILQKTIQDNQKEITSLDINENLNIFITADKEGYINLYTFPQCKLFNSYKINENILPLNNTPNEKNENINNININSSSTPESRSESNLNINLYKNDLYADIIIISHVPLPCIIFYIHQKKCLCSFSINFHLLTAKYNIDIEPNGIKKYSDYFRKDYLFIYNKKDKMIDIYDTINLEVILSSTKFEYNFIDFCFGKEMEQAYILVKIEKEKKEENNREKNNNINNNYKILMLNTPGKGENKGN